MSPIADENPFDADHLSAEEKLRNVAAIVMKYTEVRTNKGWGGRSVPVNYTQDVHTIVQVARHLAEDVIAYLEKTP